jgi:hypothetical protein
MKTHSRHDVPEGKPLALLLPEFASVEGKGGEIVEVAIPTIHRTETRNIRSGILAWPVLITSSDENAP